MPSLKIVLHQKLDCPGATLEQVANLQEHYLKWFPTGLALIEKEAGAAYLQHCEKTGIQPAEVVQTGSIHSIEIDEGAHIAQSSQPKVAPASDTGANDPDAA